VSFELHVLWEILVNNPSALLLCVNNRLVLHFACAFQLTLGLVVYGTSCTCMEYGFQITHTKYAPMYVSEILHSSLLAEGGTRPEYCSVLLGTKMSAFNRRFFFPLAVSGKSACTALTPPDSRYGLDDVFLVPLFSPSRKRLVQTYFLTRNGRLKRQECGYTCMFVDSAKRILFLKSGGADSSICMYECLCIWMCGGCAPDCVCVLVRVHVPARVFIFMCLSRACVRACVRFSVCISCIWYTCVYLSVVPLFCSLSHVCVGLCYFHSVHVIFVYVLVFALIKTDYMSDLYTHIHTHIICCLQHIFT
jgi:hypothetical protein